MSTAIQLAMEQLPTLEAGPFAAVVVSGDQIVGRGWNTVTHSHDPTAHAEVNAIRDACRNMGHYSLTGCRLYSTCEPCPMCLGACLWARLDVVYYASTRDDAAAAGFDDSLFYQAFGCPDRPDTRILSPLPEAREESLQIFEAWKYLPGKIDY